MRSHFLSLFFLVSVFACLSVSGQEPAVPSAQNDKLSPELEKEAFGLLGDVVNEAASLKLAENRAVVFAISGGLLWKSDQKRARKLFRDAGNELIQMASMPKEAKGASPGMDMEMVMESFTDSSPRGAILKMIARHDADLALELLVSTRTPELQALISAQGQPKIPGQKSEAMDPMSKYKNGAAIQREIRLEQSFAALAAEQDPQKAAKLLRDSLKRGLSAEIFGLLNKVMKKDAELASALGGEVVQAILASDLEDRDSLQFATNFLMRPGDESAAGKKEGEKASLGKDTLFRFELKSYKEVAGKIADHLLKSNSFETFFSFQVLMPKFEKYIPERVAQLKQKREQAKKGLPKEMGNISEMMEGAEPNAPSDKLMASATKMPAESRKYVYQRAVMKAMEEGGEEKASALISQIPDSANRDEARNFLDARIADKKIKDGKFEEAQKQIAKIASNPEKIARLVDLAIAAEKKKTKETHEMALSLMADANRLVNEFPETYDETNEVLKLASGYASINPDKAFPLIENLLNQSNELIAAFVVLNKFNKRESRIKDGEIVFNRNMQNLRGSAMKYGEGLGLLARADFGRAKSLASIFQRSDIRVLSKLFLVQAIFGEKMGLGPGNTFQFGDNEIEAEEAGFSFSFGE